MAGFYFLGGAWVVVVFLAVRAYKEGDCPFFNDDNVGFVVDWVELEEFPEYIWSYDGGEYARDFVVPSYGNKLL